MSIRENLKDIGIEELYTYGTYNSKLLQRLQKGELRAALSELSKSDTANLEFMEPLLYAVKKDHKTYIVYSFSESLQEDHDIAAEIIQSEPELIEGTPISRDKVFILEHMNSAPQIIEYMDKTLLEDTTVIKDICAQANINVIEEVSKNVDLSKVLSENPELCDNKDLVSKAIEQDAKLIAFASETLKNDYAFLKDAYEKNIEAVDYTAEHTEEFGECGLLAAKEVIIDNSSDKAINGFETERDKVSKQLAERKLFDNQENSDEIKRLELDEKKLERHIRFIQKIKNGEVDSVRAARLMKSICENLEPEYRKRLEQILTIDEAMKQKQQEGPKITEGEIREVAENLQELGGNPVSEFYELKEATQNGKDITHGDEESENVEPEQ